MSNEQVTVKFFNDNYGEQITSEELTRQLQLTKEREKPASEEEYQNEEDEKFENEMINEMFEEINKEKYEKIKEEEILEKYKNSGGIITGIIAFVVCVILTILAIKYREKILKSMGFSSS